MKILNINSYYYSSSVHRTLQNTLLNQGIETTSYVPIVNGYVPREESKFENEKHVIVSECFYNIDRYVFFIKHQKILNDIKKRITFNEFNVIHAHSLFSNGYIAMKLNEMYGIPYIVAVRNTDIHTFFKKAIHLRRIGRKILKNAKTIVFISQPYKDYLVNKYISNIQLKKEILNKSYIIPNGIDTFWFENKGEPRELKNKKSLNLLYVGVISKRKNLLTTVRAIEILRDKGYFVNFTIVGKINDSDLYEEIKKHPFVNYISPRSKEDLINIYQSNDIFVMPSITETFGLVYAEAMSQGLPVIYTKDQGFDKQFKDGLVGYSVDCFNQEEIANKVLKIQENYKQMSIQCLTVYEKFNWQLIVKNYIDLYKLNKIECKVK